MVNQDYWDSLIEIRKLRSTKSFDSVRDSDVLWGLIGVSPHFRMKVIGAWHKQAERQTFWGEIAPPNAAWDIQFEDGRREFNIGRRGLTEERADGLKYGRAVPFVARSNAHNPVSLVYFDKLPLWGVTGFRPLKHYNDCGVDVAGERFVRLKFQGNPEMEDPQKRASLILDTRRKVAISYDVSFAGEPVFAMSFNSVAFTQRPSDDEVIERYGC